MQAAAKEFVTVWPPYLDAERTLPEGRRVPKGTACECVRRSLSVMCYVEKGGAL